MIRKKIGIAMSGGVDSSVSASLLIEQGYEVHGFFMQLPVNGSREHLKRVTDVAARLAIPLHVIDLTGHFSATVIDYFIRTYLRGHTPNPCMICNKLIKFGLLLEAMRGRGMDNMATGHYARIQQAKDGSCVLCRGADPQKDQSYFLARVPQNLLRHILFPLGGLTKKEVYLRAAELKLSGLHGPESQDICFLAGQNLAGFFASQGISDRPGDIVTDLGEPLGKHHGIWRYTIGQRKGLGLPDASPWYVKELDAAKNRVIVCKNQQLMSRTLRLRQVEWQEDIPADSWQGSVRIRAGHRPVAARLSPAGAAEWLIEFEQEQRAVTPGQFAVFYDGDQVRGSGVIAGKNEAGGA